MSNRQVLVIDFEPVRLKATVKLLEGGGFTVDTVGSSSELNTALAGRLAPVVVIEPMLPGHDGFSICRAMKRGDMGAVPNVVIAARIFRGQRYKAMAKDAGADIFLQRPDHDALLVKVIEQMIGANGGALPAGKKNWEEQVGDPLEFEPSASHAIDAAAGPLDDFDWDQFENQFDKAFDGLTGQKPSADPAPPAPKFGSPPTHIGPAALPAQRYDGPDIGPMPSGPIGRPSSASAAGSKPEAISSEVLATLDKHAARKLEHDAAAWSAPAEASDPAPTGPASSRTDAKAAESTKRKPTLLIAIGVVIVALAGGYVLMQWLSGGRTSTHAALEPAVSLPAVTSSQPETNSVPPPTPIEPAPDVLPETQPGVSSLPADTGASDSTTNSRRAVPPPTAPGPKPDPAANAPPIRTLRPQAASEIKGSASSPPRVAPQQVTVSPPVNIDAPAIDMSPAEPEVVPDTAPATAETVTMSDPLADEPIREEPMVPSPANAIKPKLIPSSRVEPSYPQVAKQARQGGQVTLSLVVKADGTVGDVKILSEPAARLGLGKAAVAAVKRWRYSPGTYMGNPVDTTQTVVLNFNP